MRKIGTLRPKSRKICRECQISRLACRRIIRFNKLLINSSKLCATNKASVRKIPMAGAISTRIITLSKFLNRTKLYITKTKSYRYRSSNPMKTTFRKAKTARMRSEAASIHLPLTPPSTTTPW